MPHRWRHDLAFMSLNGRIALLCVVALLLAPLWLPLLPLLLWWWRRQRHAAAARGYEAINAIMARTLVAYAEATLPVPPAGGWEVVARNVDRYLAQVRSPRHWRIFAVLTLLEFAPLLRAGLPLSRQTVTRRRRFLELHMATTSGLLAIPALARQLVRMGYYTDAGIAQGLGFRTMQQRRRATRPFVAASMAIRKAVG